MFNAAAIDNTKGMAWPQITAVIMSQAIRNELESFHGEFGNGKRGFITDDEMMRLNIAIRHVVYETQQHMKMFSTILEKSKQNKKLTPQEASVNNWITFQLSTFEPSFMEKPGTPELEAAYEKYVEGYEGISS